MPRCRVHRVGPILLALLLLAGGGSRAGADERRTPVVAAVAKAGPAVINIRTEEIVKRSSPLFSGFDDPLFDEFFRQFGPSRLYKTESLGSGVIIDPEGHALTNAHVIVRASRIFVALPGRGKELGATLTGMDETLDLAVLKIEGSPPFPFLPPGRSDDLMLGEPVIAIGNPLGLGHSITTGVVSAPLRRVTLGGNEAFPVFIQTDALINPGNSGGPLLNIKGELIGINTALIQDAQGIGFSIPIDMAKRVVPDLIALSRVRHGFLGVVPVPVGAAFAEARGRGGALVKEVEPGSPAAKAGLEMGDVLLALDGLDFETPAEFFALLRTYPPGTSLEISFLRGLETGQTRVLLAAMPAGYGLRFGERVYGIAVEDGRGGLTVSRVNPGSEAGRIGVRPGDLIARVEDTRVEDAAAYNRALEEHLGRESLGLLIVRGGRAYKVELPGP